MCDRKVIINRLKLCVVLYVFAYLLSGCASFGEGVANAVMNKAKDEDVRVCEIWGERFTGIKQRLQKHSGKVKVLMTHGVGDHIPGYSTEFMEKLAAELDLNVRSRASKNISLTHPENPGVNLGNLRVTRYLNKERNEEMLFYELTWSEITKDQKALLAFDNSGEYSFRRTEVNNMMKGFANDTGPDPIIYLGESRGDILAAFGQSFCWMAQGNWDHLPSEHGRPVCSSLKAKASQFIEEDEFVFVSHSLGSRITIDGMQLIAEKLQKFEPEADEQAEAKRIIQAIQKKHVPIFMLSNQLPMLQLGRTLPEVSSQKQNYCTPDAPYYDERMVNQTSIIAFSDPNDLLSYAIPPGFSNTYLDSRLCTKVTNVNINVAHIMDIFGLGKVANPLTAHIGYDTDERVIALLAKGVGQPETAELVEQRCQWTELIDN